MAKERSIQRKDSDKVGGVTCRNQEKTVGIEQTAVDRKQESEEEGAGHGVDIVLRTNVVNACL